MKILFKRKSTYILLLIIISSIILGFTAFGTEEKIIKPAEAIETVYKTSKAELEEININSYVILENQFIEIDKWEEICNDITDKLKINVLDVSKQSDNGFRQIIYKGKTSDNIDIVLISQSTQYEGFKESSIVLDIIMTKDEYQLSKICDNIREVLEAYGQTKLNITLTGHFKGKVDNQELKNRLEEMLESVGAKEIEGIRESDIISLTGYTGNIKENISYSGKKANINIAARYNSYENKTNIWIGTPLISIGY